jgi:hypothetical protein
LIRARICLPLEIAPYGKQAWPEESLSILSVLDLASLLRSSCSARACLEILMGLEFLFQPHGTPNRQQADSQRLRSRQVANLVFLTTSLAWSSSWTFRAWT